MSTEIERIAVLELKVQTLTEEIHDMSSKLDDLLLLKSKGVGAFWLASTLLGTGIIGIVIAVSNWLRG